MSVGQTLEQVSAPGPDEASAGDLASTPLPELQEMALRLQRGAGNRATAAWAARIARKPAPAPADPIDADIKAGWWAHAALLLNDKPKEEIAARIKKLKPKQRELLMADALGLDQHAHNVMAVMFEVDQHSWIVGAIRRKQGVDHDLLTVASLFSLLSPDDARSLARELKFTHDQLVFMVDWNPALKTTFKDPWAYTSLDERMRYVMEALVFTYGYPVHGAAGLVGNLTGESGLIPSRLEGSKELNPTRSADNAGKMTDWTDEEIRDRVYGKSGPKLPGVGIAQWTLKARRQAFFSRPEEIGILYDLDAQVDFLVDELAASYAGLDKTLRDPKTTTQAAADAVLEKFENPADPEQSRTARRNAAAKAEQIFTAAHPAPAAAPAAP